MTPPLAARHLALYLLSLLAMASPEIAWGHPDPGRLAGDAAALAVTLVLGEVVADALSGVGAPSWRRRARFLVSAVYAAVAFGALAAATGGGELAGRASRALGLLQLMLLVAAEFLGLRTVMLANLLLLVMLAAMAGGLPAMAAVTGATVLLPFFMAFDRLASRLGGLPPLHDRGPVVRAVTRETTRLVVPLVFLLASLFLWAPPTPPSLPAPPAAASLPSETREAYHWLTLLALLGGGLVLAAARLLRGRGEPTSPLLDNQETLVLAEEDLEPERLDEARYGPGRGRVILAYLRFLNRARELGHEIGASLTPREIARHVPVPASSLAVLTAAFMDARYGPDEPSLEAIRAAETASRELRGKLPRSRRRRRSVRT